jgi:hypothetical protein
MRAVNMTAGLAFVAALFALHAQTSPPHKTVLPAAPADLLKLLPATPSGWQLRQSRAKSFYNESLVSQANRELVGPPSQPGPGNATPAPPPLTRVSLTDTAYVPALYSDFEGFKPGTYGNTESLNVDGLPARRIKFGDGDRLRILVKSRFVIEVQTHNQAPNASIAWARLFDIRKINDIPDSVVTSLPNPVTVVSLDEVNPKANSSYQVNWSTQEDLDAARRRKP